MPNFLANNANAAVSTQPTSKEDVLEDGTRVIHMTTIEIYPDGLQYKHIITQRIDTTLPCSGTGYGLSDGMAFVEEFLNVFLGGRKRRR